MLEQLEAKNSFESVGPLPASPSEENIVTFEANKASKHNQLAELVT